MFELTGWPMTCKQLCLCLAGLTGTGLLFAQTPIITVTGADEALRRNIVLHVGQLNIPCDATAARMNRFLPQIRDDVNRAARSLGYYFLVQRPQFSQGQGCWRLDIETVPGAPVLIDDITISILRDEAFFSTLLGDLPLNRGDQLNHGGYEQIKSILSAGAIQNGYFDARFNSSQLLLDLNARLADIEIEFDPQERYLFGELEIQALDELDEDFVRRFVEIVPGIPYSADALIELRNTLNQSLYFSEVSVTPALDRAANARVPVQVALQVRPRRVYGVGAGVTTDIGPRLRLDYQDRYLNRRGHNLNANVATSPIRQEVDLNYIIPMARPAFENLRLSAGVLNEDNDTYENRTLKIGTTYSRMNRFNFRHNYYLNYQHDEFHLNEQDEIANLFILGSNIARTDANDAIYPTAGWRTYAELRGASKALLSSTSFTQLYASGKYVRQIGFGRVLAKLDAGVSWVDDLDELPVSVQFFAGGDQSVRGYRYQSLGPLNDAGELIGGRHLLAFGLEYDFSVLPAWKLAVFADAGNAFNTFNDYELKTGAGIGLRWLSPIGPVRLDLASALDDDRRWRIHITMGPDL